MKYAIINSEKVVNIIEWDGEPKLNLPKDDIAILANENCAIGGTYIDDNFTLPETSIVDTSEDDSWNAAVADMIGADVQDIASRDDLWKKCVWHGLRNNMEEECWVKIKDIYL